jgi:hypothetical protein
VSRAAPILLATVLVALCAGAQAAGATAHYDTSAPSSSFSGSQLATHTWTVQSTGGLTIVLSCTSVTYDGLTPASSGTLTSFRFNFHPASCSLAAPAATLAVTPPWCGNAWRIDLNNNYNAGSTFGTWTTCTRFTFHVDPLNCDITYAYTTVADSVGMTDRTAADTADAPYTTAGGMRLFWDNVPLSYTSTCAGLTTPGVGVFNGSAFLPRVWIGP